MSKTKPVVAINLRLPRELHAALKQQGQKELRSLQKQIIYILSQYVGSDA